MDNVIEAPEFRESRAAESSGQPALTVGFVGNIVTRQIAERLVPLIDRPIDLVEHPIDQVFQMLETASPAAFLIVHLDHRWFFDVAPGPEAIEQAGRLAKAVRSRLGRAAGAVVLNTLPYLPTALAESQQHEVLETLAEIEKIMFALARENNRVHVVDVRTALSRVGFERAIRERNRLLMQMPYSPLGLDAIAQGYARSIQGAIRARKKVVVVDADNTLWGGVVGEDGCDGIACDREYPGIVHWTFQAQLKKLRETGVLLAAVTKNNESDFVEVFSERKMPLSLTDFAAWRSNWSEKSANIADIANQLNLGLDSFVFIDDNPFEIEEVRTHLPMVECVQFPQQQPERVLELLSSLDSLRVRSLTAEDLTRSEQYRVEAERETLRVSTTSMDDYLASLELKLEVGVNRRSQLARITQLTNKTNQFNLTTRRYSESEMERMMASGRVYDFRLIDRFGDMGVVGIAIVRDSEIDTFLMSCRALGRKLESTMLRRLCDDAKDTPLIASFRATKKNAMVSEFYDVNGFELVETGDGIKHYRQAQGPERTPYIKIVDV
jgi:FkbH-like protein